MNREAAYEAASDAWLKALPDYLNGEAEWRIRFDAAREAFAAAEAAQPVTTDPVREALEVLLAAYEEQMHSEHDYPGRPWTPERDNDTAALNARAALAAPQAAAVAWYSNSGDDMEWGERPPARGGNWKPLYASPPPAPAAHADLDAMVNRFLSWRLPDGFAPDCGISFNGRGKDAMGYEKTWPVGTNLLTAEQARQMLAYVIGAPPAPAQARDAERWCALLAVIQDDYGAEQGPEAVRAVTALADEAINAAKAQEGKP